MNDPASHKASQGAVTPANDDHTLLRHYAEEGSEAAFTALVRRRVDLVYSVALRRTGGDAHRAADVAQQVFIALARDARKLSRHTVLSAWLHTATRNAALNLMISEKRRQARELVALDPAIAGGGAATDPDWDRLRPVLDAAIDELPENDRAAVVLRFLERRPFAEIGATLHLSEDAARMRTDRALDKLRATLAGRGITSTAAALGAIVSSQPVVSAPAGLAAALASQSLATAGASAGLLATFAAIMNTKIITTAAFSAVVFFALGAYVGFDYTTSQPLPPPPETLLQAQKIASLRDQNERLRAEVDRLTALNSSLSKSRAVPTPAPAAGPPSAAEFQSIRSISQQKAMLNNLRQIAAARAQFQLENGRPPASMDDLVGETKYIRRLNPVDGESYAGLSLMVGSPLTVTTLNGVSVTYDPEGGTTTNIPSPPPTPEMARLVEMTQRLTPAIKNAVEAYRAAHDGATPSNMNPEALIPYFSTPQEGADFVEFLAAQKAAQR